MLDTKFTEQLILKGCMTDNKYTAMVSSAIEDRYFESLTAAKLYGFLKTHFIDFKQVPTQDTILHSFTENERQDVKELLTTVNSVDVNVAERFDFLVESTDEWLKHRAIQVAIMDSVDIISQKKEDIASIRSIVEKALTKTLKMDLGLNYFDDLGERLRRIFTKADIRIPTYFPSFDEVIHGGFPPFTLNIFPGRIHAGKSLTMINFISRQVMAGHNPVLFTLEMSQDSMAQRLDSILSGYDINKIYVSKQKELMTSLKEASMKEGRGTLYVKQFPPASATVNDFRTYMHELSIRGHHPDIIYCDYVNLMKPTIRQKNSNMYEDVKRIAEELRAMSFEFGVPIVSVTQYNRGGMAVPLSELDYIHISESIGLGATCDSLFLLGLDDDMQVYQCEMHYKVLKNRIGGRVGHLGKFYVDDRSLKMYDELELQTWMDNLARSEGSDALHQQARQQSPQTRQRS